MENVDYLAEANRWNQRREEHLRLADFCEEQYQRFIGAVAVPDDFKPDLVLVEG